MLQTIIVKEKINLKDPILPSYMLNDEEISMTLNKWIKLLDQHQIHVVFNQTPVNIHEQYDYLANEFMYMELPPHPNGMHFSFMYDRVQSWVHWCELDKMVHQMLEEVFRKKHITVLPNVNRRLHFNEYEHLSEPEFNYLVANHTNKSSTITHCKIDIKGREMINDSIDITGRYVLGYSHACHCELLQGGWKVSLSNQEGNWAVKSLFIDGF